MTGDPGDVDRIIAMSDLTTPWAIRAFVTLELPELLVEPARSTDVAELRRCDAQTVERLLRHLAARGVCRQTATGEFELTGMGRCLLPGHPSRMATWMNASGVIGRMDAAYAGLPAAVREGRPCYADLHGRDFYADLASDPALHREFDELMSTDAVDYPAMLADVTFSADERLVDVGGGQGRLLAALLDRHTDLTGVLFELPDTVAVISDELAAHVETGRAVTVAGDMFAALTLPEDDRPRGISDTLLFVSVLHNFSDADVTRVLTHGRDAQAGRLLIMDQTVEGGVDSPWVTHLDLKMLIVLGGRERTRADFAAIAADAGWSLVAERVVRRGPFAAPYAVLEFEPR